MSKRPAKKDAANPGGDAPHRHGLIDLDLLRPHHAHTGAPQPAPISPVHLDAHHARHLPVLPPAPESPSMRARVRGFLWRHETPKEAPKREAEPAEKPVGSLKHRETPRAKQRAATLHERFLERRAARAASVVPSPAQAAGSRETPVQHEKGDLLSATKPASPGPAAPEQKPAKPKVSFREQMKKKEKPAHKKLQRRSLAEYLRKAGFEIPADTVRRRIWLALLLVFLLISAYVLVRSALWGAGALDVLIFLAGLWIAGFAGAFLLAQGVVYFFLDYRIYRRTREIEQYLPDFLQLASSNIAAGMPIDRALWMSIRPSFGVLAKEMEMVAKSTMAGESLEASLTRFTDAYDSPVLRRSVAILIEGLRAGGEMADLLNKIALNIEELRIMRQEMAANVTTYAIFITFASVIVAPFLFALATQLLQIIVGITGKLDLSSTNGFFTLAAADPAVIGRFTMFSVIMLVVSTAFSAALVSVIKRGNVLEGIKSIPLYAISAVIIYYVSLGVLNSAFGGILTG